MKETCHFIGIGGIGMSGLAKLLLEKKVVVTGSDLAHSPLTKSLENQGAHIHIGQKKGHIKPGMTVIYSSSIKETNPEYLAATQMQCPMLHRSDLLLQLTKGYKTLAVTGTHGKTTTSALLASVLAEAGLDPSFAIGGVLPSFNSNARHGKGEFFVAEADESDGTFLKYDTFAGIITNTGRDHLDTFGDENQLLLAFETFGNKVQKHLLWCGDDERLQTLSLKGISYGFSEHCQWRVCNFRQKGWKNVFDAMHGNTLYKEIEVNLIGRHQALNALAVFALALSLGVQEEKIRTALRSFAGIKRRCEKKREERKILVLDDYAHHPTEIKTTLQGIREAVQERRLIALFQPHRYSRTRDCLGSYHSIFEDADLVIVTDIYAAGETPIPNVSPQTLMKEIETPCHYVPREALAPYLQDALKPHDVLVTLGAGDITQVADALTLETNTLKVGVVFGGRSVEHEVSIRSADFVQKSLERAPYEVHPFKISPEGHWEENALQKLTRCDIVFPVLHGKYGEDGTIQGLFEMLDLPYVGCDHRSSALCMDKAFLKHLMLQHDIATSPFIDFSHAKWKESPEDILQKLCKTLTFPLFVKGVHLGSAISVQKVETRTHLLAAIDEAFRFDTHVLVEKGLEAREIEFAVLGNEKITAFPPGEVKTGGQVYDYQAKYIDDWVQIDAQAALSEQQKEEGIALAKQVYHIARCTGMARVDFFLDKQNNWWFNEINPIPGFTEISLYPQICAANGLGAEALMDKLLILGLQRSRTQQRKNRYDA